MRRIPEVEESNFKASMGRFLEDKAKFNYLSLPSTRNVNCNCLKRLLAINSNRKGVFDKMFSFWQLGLKERDSLFINKVYNIMDEKVGTDMNRTSNVRFRGRLFLLRGVFTTTESMQSQNGYYVCHDAYPMIYEIEYYEPQSVKKVVRYIYFQHRRCSAS